MQPLLFCSVQDGIYSLRKAHMCSIPLRARPLLPHIPFPPFLFLWLCLKPGTWSPLCLQDLMLLFRSITCLLVCPSWSLGGGGGGPCARERAVDVPLESIRLVPPCIQPEHLWPLIPTDIQPLSTWVHHNLGSLITEVVFRSTVFSTHCLYDQWGKKQTASSLAGLLHNQIAYPQMGEMTYSARWQALANPSVWATYLGCCTSWEGRICELLRDWEVCTALLSSWLVPNSCPRGWVSSRKNMGDSGMGLLLMPWLKGSWLGPRFLATAESAKVGHHQFAPAPPSVGPPPPPPPQVCKGWTSPVHVSTTLCGFPPPPPPPQHTPSLQRLDITSSCQHHPLWAPPSPQHTPSLQRLDITSSCQHHPPWVTPQHTHTMSSPVCISTTLCVSPCPHTHLQPAPPCAYLAQGLTFNLLQQLFTPPPFFLALFHSPSSSSYYNMNNISSNMNNISNNRCHRDGAYSQLFVNVPKLFASDYTYFPAHTRW